MLRLFPPYYHYFIHTFPIRYVNPSRLFLLHSLWDAILKSCIQFHPHLWYFRSIEFSCILSTTQLPQIRHYVCTINFIQRIHCTLHLANDVGIHALRTSSKITQHCVYTKIHFQTLNPFLHESVKLYICRPCCMSLQESTFKRHLMSMKNLKFASLVTSLLEGIAKSTLQRLTTKLMPLQIRLLGAHPKSSKIPVNLFKIRLQLLYCHEHVCHFCV